MLDLTTPIDRIRSVLGDVGTTSLHPDGLAYYTQLLAVSADEATACRAAAAGLAAFLQQKPIQLGGGGKSLAFDPNRVAKLQMIANGVTPYPFDEDGNPIMVSQGGSTTIEVVW